MNILVITSDSTFPSKTNPTAGIFFANLLRRLNALAGRLVVVTPVAYVPKPLERLPRFRSQLLAEYHDRWNGIDVFRPRYLSARAKKRLSLQSRSYCWSIGNLCHALNRRDRYDLVLAQGFGPPTHAAQWFAKQIGKRSVAWAIGSDIHRLSHVSPDNARHFQHNVRYNDIILTVSNAIRNMMLARAPRARHIHTFYRGIDLTDFSASADKAAIRAKLGLQANRQYMLTAGGVIKSKGSDEFYAAFRQLAAGRDSLSAIWVGTGTESESLLQQAKADGLASRLIFTGRVPRPTVLEYMQAADVMAFASHGEGLPNVVMEALAAGLPVVATKVGGTAEIVADGLTGLIVPPQDETALTDAVARQLDDPHQARQMAEQGRKLITQHFDVDRNAAVLMDVLRHIAAGGSAEQSIPSCAGVEPGCLPIDAMSAESTTVAATPRS